MSKEGIYISQGADPRDNLISDLEALQGMAIYMRSELQQAGSCGFWLVAALPKLLQEEIDRARMSRSGGLDITRKGGGDGALRC